MKNKLFIFAYFMSDIIDHLGILEKIGSSRL